MGAVAGKLQSCLWSPLWNSGTACMGLAAFIFSLSGLFVKLLKGVPEFEIVAFRSLLSFIAAALASYKNGITPFCGHLKNVPLLLGRALSGACGMSLYYFCIGQISLADAVTLFFLNPAITAVVAWPILKEPLGLLGMAGVGLSLTGVVLVSQPPVLFNKSGEEWSKSQSIGTGLGIASAFFASMAFVFIRLIGKKESPITMSVYFHGMAFVTSGIPLAAGFPQAAVLPSPFAWLLLLGIAVSSFWGQLLIGRGLQLLKAAHASAINITQVLYSYVFGVVILGEHLSLLSIVGSLLIASGVICVSSKPKAEKSGQDYARISTNEETTAEGAGPGTQAQQQGGVQMEEGLSTRVQAAGDKNTRTEASTVNGNPAAAATPAAAAAAAAGKGGEQVIVVAQNGGLEHWAPGHANGHAAQTERQQHQHDHHHHHNHYHYQKQQVQYNHASPHHMVLPPPLPPPPRASAANGAAGQHNHAHTAVPPGNAYTLHSGRPLQAPGLSRAGDGALSPRTMGACTMGGVDSSPAGTHAVPPRNSLQQPGFSRTGDGGGNMGARTMGGVDSSPAGDDDMGLANGISFDGWARGEGQQGSTDGDCVSHHHMQGHGDVEGDSSHEVGQGLQRLNDEEQGVGCYDALVGVHEGGVVNAHEEHGRRGRWEG